MEADLNLDVSLETCFQAGGDVSSQVSEMGELQFPNRLPRQLLQSRAPQTNQLGGVVLSAPGAPWVPGVPGAPGMPLQSRARQANQLGGVVLQAPGAQGTPGAPLQTLTPSQQALHSSLTAIHNVRKSKTLKHSHFCWNYASGKLTYFFQQLDVRAMLSLIACTQAYNIAIYNIDRTLCAL